MPLYFILFFRLSLAFLYPEVSYHYEMLKKIQVINFSNEICLIDIKIIASILLNLIKMRFLIK